MGSNLYSAEAEKSDVSLDLHRLLYRLHDITKRNSSTLFPLPSHGNNACYYIVQLSINRFVVVAARIHLALDALNRFDFPLDVISNELIASQEVFGKMWRPQCNNVITPSLYRHPEMFRRIPCGSRCLTPGHNP